MNQIRPILVAKIVVIVCAAVILLELALSDQTLLTDFKPQKLLIIERNLNVFVSLMDLLVLTCLLFCKRSVCTILMAVWTLVCCLLSARYPVFQLLASAILSFIVLGIILIINFLAELDKASASKSENKFLNQQVLLRLFSFVLLFIPFVSAAVVKTYDRHEFQSNKVHYEQIILGVKDGSIACNPTVRELGPNSIDFPPHISSIRAARQNDGTVFVQFEREGFWHMGYLYKNYTRIVPGSEDLRDWADRFELEPIGNDWYEFAGLR